MLDRRRMLMTKKSRLPIEYQEVEYIQSTGTQNISIPNQVVSQNIKAITKFANGSISGLTNTNFLYAFYSQANYTFSCALNSTNTLRVSNGRDSFKNSSSFNNIGTMFHTIEHTLTSIKLDGVDISNGNICGYINGNSNTLNLFYRNTQEYNKSQCKIKSFKFYVDDILDKELVPCYCTKIVKDVNGEICQSGTAGMYDTVNNVFYINQSSGEDFIVGPNVN